MEKLRFRNLSSSWLAGISASTKAAINYFAHLGVDPVMLFVLSGALVYGPVYGFFLGVSIMVIADFLVGLVGLWTVYTALAFGLVGILAGVIGMFKKQFKRIELAGMAFVFTLLFDAIAMTAFAWQFGIPLAAATVSQVPVTIIHLTCNTLLAFVFAPSIIRALNEISDPRASQSFRERVFGKR
jgi:LytS/YehU family sensor histidine kinase